MDSAQAERLAARSHLQSRGWIPRRSEAFHHLPPPALEHWLGEPGGRACAAPPLEGAGWTLGVFDTLADAEKAVAAFNAQPAADVAAMLTETALKRFTCEVECKALGDDGKQYDAVWCPDCGQIYYTIPAKVKVLGYIPQYKED